MNLNKVLLAGWLTRDPEVHQFENGGKVANLGFVVHNRRRAASGEWEEVPVWLQLKAFNRENGRKLADFAATLTKGRLMFVEGHLGLEEWTGKEDGKKHTRTIVYVDELQYVGSRPADRAAGEGGAAGPGGGGESGFTRGGSRGQATAGGRGKAGNTKAGHDLGAEPTVTEGEMAMAGAGAESGPVFGAKAPEAGKPSRRLLGRPARD
jgi:single-strand DNA-binding protein